MLKRILVTITLLLLVGTTAWAEEPKPAEAPPPPELKIHVEASYAKASGNSSTSTVAAKAGIKYEGPVDRYYLNGEYLYSKSEGNETANKLATEARWEHVITDGFFGFLAATYVSDRLSGYDYRLTGGPGLGYETVIAENHKLKGMLSVVASYDRYSVGPKKDDTYASGNAALEYEWKITETVTFSEKASYRQSMAYIVKSFTTSETGLKVKVNDHLGLGVSYKLEYQNDPPAAGVKRLDTVVLTSLVVDY